MIEPQPNGGLGTPREAFLERVRAALGHAQSDPPAQPPPGVDESIARLARTRDELIELFMKRATVVGMKAYRIKSADLIKQVVALLEQIGAKRVVVGAGSVPQALPLKDALRRKGVEVVDWLASPGFEVQFDVDCGITDVHGAIAESGTIVCASDPGHSRGLSLVPPAHIALVRKSDILPDMIDLWRKMNGRPNTELPSSLAMITGPSKTADIEGELIVGVHGPGQVHVVVMEDA